MVVFVDGMSGEYHQWNLPSASLADAAAVVAAAPSQLRIIQLGTNGTHQGWRCRCG